MCVKLKPTVIYFRAAGHMRPLPFQQTQSVSHPHAQTNRFPSSRCASAIQIVRPSESRADTQPQLQPALLRLSAMISQYRLTRGSDALPFGRLWYTKPDDAIGYAKHCSRSHNAVIGVSDECAEKL